MVKSVVERREFDEDESGVCGAKLEGSRQGRSSR